MYMNYQIAIVVILGTVALPGCCCQKEHEFITKYGVDVSYIGKSKEEIINHYGPPDGDFNSVSDFLDRLDDSPHDYKIPFSEDYIVLHSYREWIAFQLKGDVFHEPYIFPRHYDPEWYKKPPDNGYQILIYDSAHQVNANGSIYVYLFKDNKLQGYNHLLWGIWDSNKMKH